MANFTAQDVNALRKSTGVGMMDCKNALVEADGDMDKAAVILREKGLATQAKKAGRVAAEGLVVAYVNADNTEGAIAEVNSETDFVAKNPEFVSFANAVAKTAAEGKPADVDALYSAKISGGTGETVKEALDTLFLKIRENLGVRRFECVNGILVSYIHGEGRIGVMVTIESSLGSDNAALLECGKNCALQIAALNPTYLDRDAVPADVIESEREIIKKQMAEDPKMANKPEQVIGKIAEGKLDKSLSETCLMEQEFVKDGNMNVKQYVESVAKSLGGDIKIKSFIRYERGEGVEKEASNLADEVANMIKG